MLCAARTHLGGRCPLSSSPLAAPPVGALATPGGGSGGAAPAGVQGPAVGENEGGGGGESVRFLQFIYPRL